jgi:hypothetical protein
VCFIVSLFLIQNTTGSGFAGARAGGLGAIVGLITMFAREFWVASLFWSSFGSIILYFLVAQSYAVHTVVALVWREKMSGFVFARIERYLQKISAARPDWMKSLGEQALLRVRLLDAVRNDPSLGRVERTVLQFGFRQLKLDDVNFQDSSVGIASIVNAKVEAKLSEIATPSLFHFHLLNGCMLALLVLALVFDKK